MIAIEKLVLIIIFLIILALCIYLVIGLVQPNGGRINLLNQIRECCSNYRAATEYGCPESASGIVCGNSNLDALSKEAQMTSAQLKEFCQCPNP
jgi:hypothetical protein